jgi:glycosyltransferase involved in cell wall biosynthesis
MGLGRPVIATARGGSAEYLRDEVNALVVAHDDPRAVAAAVERLADDPGLRARLREGGLATAAEHTAEAFHARVEAALLDEVNR